MPSTSPVGSRPASPGWSGGRLWGLAVGVALVTLGVLLQLPDMAMVLTHHDMAADGSAGMAMWTPTMAGGMLLSVAGVVVGSVALFRGSPRPQPGAGHSLDAIQHGNLRPAHGMTYFALLVALVEVNMTPLMLGYVLPGMSREYGIPLAEASLLPLLGLTGTVVGSVAWGLLADRYGRRGALVVGTLIFMATSACGAMPSFGWNLFMCFVMGIPVGGLLPLAFTFIAELTPHRHRGWVPVGLGAVGGLGGYLAASTAAHYLEPMFGWRVLWLVGLPAGLLLLALTRLIPESPLHLLRIGRRAEAETVLARYASRLAERAVPTPAAGENQAAGAQRLGIRALLRGHPMVTAVLGSVGVVWGLVNFGFLVLLPEQLRVAGMTGGAVSGLVAKSALYSAPALVIVVLLYAYWSVRRSVVLFVTATALALSTVALWSLGVIGNGQLVVAVGMLVLAQAAVNAVLLPYSAEVYPTALRATGTGFVAAATKFGGLAGPWLVLVSLNFGSGLHAPALVLAVLALISAVLVFWFGLEVRARVADRAGTPREVELVA